MTDLLPEGTEYVDGSLEIEKYPATLGGTPTGSVELVTGITPEENGQELSISLGDINDVYVIKYKTKVTEEGMKETTFQNKVTLTDKDLENTNAHATVDIERGEPLAKTSEYDRYNGIITYTVDFNFDEENLRNITLLDEWTNGDKVEFVNGSLTFQEMEIDENGNALEVEGADGNESLVGGNLSVEEGKFEVTGITTDKPYRITYQLKLKERELDGFTINNTVSFEGNEVGHDREIGQFVGEKGFTKVDFQNREIEWRVRINKDNRVMKNVVIEDTLGEGLTLIEDSIEIEGGREGVSDWELRQPVENPFYIDGIGDIDRELTITYRTTYDPDNLPDDESGTMKHAINHVNVAWTSEDGTDYDRTFKAESFLNYETFDNSWKHGSYDPDSKEITWTIIANYRQNKHDNFTIVDKPQQNQQLVEDSIKVYELNIKPDGKYDYGPDEEVTITPTIDGNKFTIDLGKTDKAYAVQYKTTLEGLDEIHQLYENDVIVLDGNEMINELDASVQVYGDTKYGNKSGEQKGKKINWSVEVNNAQQVINNLEFTDTIRENATGELSQAYLEDTIKVYEAKVNPENGRLIKGDEFDASNYELTVEKGEFTIAWNDQVNRAFIVEYSTLFFAKDQEEVTNNYKITGDSIEKGAEDAADKGKVLVRQSDAGGSGESGYLKIHKIDVTSGEEVRPLVGVEFTLYDNEGNELKTVVTDNEGYADFGRLLYGNYTVKETKVPEGYVAIEDIQVEINKKYVRDTEEGIHEIEVENYRPNYNVELLKTDEEGNTLEGAEFTLFTEGGDEVETKATDKDGKIIFEDLEPGNYYVKETKAPTGYLQDNMKHEVKVVEDQKEPIQVNVENKVDNMTTTEVKVEKIWKGSRQEDSVTIKLLANDEEVDSVELTEADDWKHVFTDLRAFDDEGQPIEYTVEEIKINRYTIEITGNAEDGFIVTNTYHPPGGGGWIPPEDPEGPGDPEDPEDPENPEDPGDPEDPEDPEDSENPEDPEDPKDGEEDDGSMKGDGDSKDSEDDGLTKGEGDMKEPSDQDKGDGEGTDVKDDSDQVGEDGKTLPNTATNIFNSAIIGVILLVLGLILAYRRKTV